MATAILLLPLPVDTALTVALVAAATLASAISATCLQPCSCCRKAELAAAMALLTAATATSEPAGADLAALSRRAVTVFWNSPELGFDHLGQLFLGLGGDFIDGTGVGDGLLDVRLGQGGLDGQSFLDVLPRRGGPWRRTRRLQDGTGGVQVEGSDTLGGSQDGVSQASSESTVDLLAEANCSGS